MAAGQQQGLKPDFQTLTSPGHVSQRLPAYSNKMRWLLLRQDQGPQPCGALLPCHQTSQRPGTSASYLAGSTHVPEDLKPCLISAGHRSTQPDVSSSEHPARSQAAAGRLSAGGLAVEHVGAEVVQVISHGRAQAEIADAVVAPRILPLLVAHPQHLRPAYLLAALRGNEGPYRAPCYG